VLLSLKRTGPLPGPLSRSWRYGGATAHFGLLLRLCCCAAVSLSLAEQSSLLDSASDPTVNRSSLPRRYRPLNRAG
jgi:hypothetical protein